MIIALTSAGKDLDSLMDSRFGRTKYIIYYDLDQSSFEVEDNDTNLNSPQGAGIQTAQRIIDGGATILITGNLGPKAFRVLNAGDVKAYNCSNQTIKDAITLYKDNKLEIMNDSNVEEHWT